MPSLEALYHYNTRRTRFTLMHKIIVLQCFDNYVIMPRYVHLTML